jgi:hypothetical protein
MADVRDILTKLFVQIRSHTEMLTILSAQVETVYAYLENHDPSFREWAEKQHSLVLASPEYSIASAGTTRLIDEVIEILKGGEPLRI